MKGRGWGLNVFPRHESGARFRLLAAGMEVLLTASVCPVRLPGKAVWRSCAGFRRQAAERPVGLERVELVGNGVDAPVQLHEVSVAAEFAMTDSVGAFDASVGFGRFRRWGLGFALGFEFGLDLASAIDMDACTSRSMAWGIARELATIPGLAGYRRANAAAEDPPDHAFGSGSALAP